MKLSRYFTLAELTRSQTAQSLGIPNVPGATETAHLRALCEQVLDPLREAIGTPIRVNSAFRARSVNARIPGASTTSQHLDGKAADIQAPAMAVLELFQRIIRMGLPFDQIIYEAMSPTAKWVHVSFDPTRRRGDIRVARFGPNGRPTGYPPVTREQALAMDEPRTRGGGAQELEYVELDDAPEPRGRRPATKKTRRVGPRATVRRPKTSAASRSATKRRSNPAKKKKKTKAVAKTARRPAARTAAKTARRSATNRPTYGRKSGTKAAKRTSRD